MDVGVNNGNPSFEPGIWARTRSPKSKYPVVLYSNGTVAPHNVAVAQLDSSPVVQLLDDRWGTLYVLHENGIVECEGQIVCQNDSAKVRMIATRGDSLIFITWDGILGPAPFLYPPRGETFDKIVSSNNVVLLLTRTGRVFTFSDDEPLSEVSIPEPSQDIIIALDFDTPAFAIGRSGALYVFGTVSFDNIGMLGLGGIDSLSRCPDVSPIGETIVLQGPRLVSPGPFLRVVSIDKCVLGLTL